MREKPPEVRNRPLLIGALLLLFILPTIFVLAPRFFEGDLKVPVEEKQAGEELSEADISTGRKNIYDRNFKELAVSFRLTSVYARPLELREPKLVANRLAKVLDLDENTLLDALKAERSFVWVGRQIGPAKADAVTDLNFKGIHLIDEVQRYYPNHQTAAHVVGFMKDEQGLAGVESYYDNVLREGNLQDMAVSSVDATGRGAVRKKDAHLILTLDLGMQSLLERELAALMKKSKATSAMAVVMEPGNGSIVALANLPAYDPNWFWDYGTDERKNRVIADQVFPGEINRLFQAAAALESGQTLSRQSLIDTVAEQSKPFDGKKVRQEDSSEAKPQMNWAQVAAGAYASAELAALSEQVISEAKQAAFAEKIGLGGKSGIDLPEEGLEGMITEPAPPDYRLGDHASSTNAISLLTAFSRLVNGGKMVVPHLLGALWEGGEKREVASGRENTSLFVRSDVSQTLLTTLGEAGRVERNSPLFFESLLPGELVESAKKFEQPTNKNQGFHVVFLGMAPGNNPDITMVMVLDNAQIDLAAPSPLRRMGKLVMNQARKVTRENRPNPANILLVSREEDNYKKWQALQSKKNGKPFLPRVRLEEKMPDVRGYSLRKALQVLQQYGLRLQVTGVGSVAVQHPAPGVSLAGVEETVLELHMDQ